MIVPYDNNVIIKERNIEMSKKSKGESQRNSKIERKKTKDKRRLGTAKGTRIKLDNLSKCNDGKKKYPPLCFTKTGTD